MLEGQAAGNDESAIGGRGGDRNVGGGAIDSSEGGRETTGETTGKSKEAIPKDSVGARRTTANMIVRVFNFIAIYPLLILPSYFHILYSKICQVVLSPQICRCRLGNYGSGQPGIIRSKIRITSV